VKVPGFSENEENNSKGDSIKETNSNNLNSTAPSNPINNKHNESEDDFEDEIVDEDTDKQQYS